MRLIFDQNISYRIVRKISHVFPESRGLRELALHDASDMDIWEYARDHSYTIVTFDSDFIDITNLRGFPPKIIWLRMGNTSTDEIAARLIDASDQVKEFIRSQEMAFMAIG